VLECCLQQWLLFVPFCGGGAVLCFRYSVPLVLCLEDRPPAGRLDAYLPLNGRWLRAGIGAVVLFAGITLMLLGGLIALFGFLSLCCGFAGSR